MGVRTNLSRNMANLFIMRGEMQSANGELTSLVGTISFANNEKPDEWYSPSIYHDIDRHDLVTCNT